MEDLCQITDQDMTPFARKRWFSMCVEDQIVLDIAYNDAIRAPYRVGFFEDWYIFGSSESHLYYAHFRFGFCHYITVDNGESVKIHDMWIDDDNGIVLDLQYL